MLASIILRFMAVACALLLFGGSIGCGGGAAPEDESSAGQQTSPDKTPPWPGSWSKLAIPFPDDTLPADTNLARQTHAETEVVRLGDEIYQISPEAILDTEQHWLFLSNDMDAFCWGIYQFPGTEEDEGPFGLRVEFALDPDSEYWAGVADYARQAWHWSRIYPAGGMDSWVVPSGLQPVSPNGNLYLALVVVAPVSCAIERVVLTKELALPAPLDLEASDGLSGSTVYLDWSDPALSYPGLAYDGVAVERADNAGGPWTEIGTVAAGETHYGDAHDPLNNDYPYGSLQYYRVLTIQGANRSEPSLVETGYRWLQPVANLAASDGAFGDGIHLSWNPVAGAGGYLLEYMNGTGDPPDWTELVSLPSQTTYIHGPATPPGHEAAELTDYIYRAKAIYEGDFSEEWSNEDQGYWLAGPVAVLTATPGRGSAPLTVLLDASGSYNTGGGTITKYEWDWEGDGVWDHNSGSDPSMEHVYREFGVFNAKVRVTDSELLESTTSAPVEVPGWVHTWGSDDIDFGNGVALDATGNVWVCGTTLGGSGVSNDAFIQKYSPAGSLILSKSWDGGSFDRLYALATDGVNLFLVGTTSKPGQDSNNVLLLKYSNSGALLWQKAWDHTNMANGYDIALDDSGAVYLVGDVENSPGGWEALILKFNPNGTLAWAKAWGGNEGDWAFGCTASGGFVYLCGTHISAADDRSIAMLRIAGDGSLDWEKFWDAGSLEGGAGIAVANGLVYVVGSTNGLDAGSTDALVLCLDSAGELQWQRRWNGGLTDQFYDVTVNGGRVYCSGSGLESGQPAIPVLVFNPAGDCLFNRLFYNVDSQDRAAFSLAIDSQARLFLTGQALNHHGGWYSSSIDPVTISGVSTNANLAYYDAGNTVLELTGTEASFTGVLDAGGGSEDSLIICYETLLTE